MNEVEFKKWLSTLSLKQKPVRDIISRCRTVERSLQKDLDKEYDKDHCQKVLSALVYSIGDELAGKPAPKGFDFKPGAHIRFRFTDMRSAVRKYILFRESVSK